MDNNKRIRFPKEIEDQAKLVLVALNEKPRTSQEIIDVVRRLTMRVGMSVFLEEIENIEFFMNVRKSISYLEQVDMIQVDENQIYSLTDSGKIEAQKYAKGMYSFFAFTRSLTNPGVSPVLSLIFHLFLGTFKLIGFTITGSVSLFGDGLDSAIDGISSIIVGFAMRINKEKQATYLLLVLMLITGIITIHQSIDRLLMIILLGNIIVLKEEILAIIIAGISIILCTLLYLYQRFSGYSNRNLTILAQSEDSRNHVLNALLVLLAVLAGYLAVITDFNILYSIDGMVGCFIGLIILQGAYEIFQDLKAEAGGEKIDYERYKLGVWKRYDKIQNKILDLWILWKVDKGIKTYTFLEETFDQDFQPIVIKHSEERQHVWKTPQTRELLKKRFDKLLESDFLREDKKRLDYQSQQLIQVVSLTTKGINKLNDEFKEIERKKDKSKRIGKRKRRHERRIE